jgi:hypothetical protein
MPGPASSFVPFAGTGIGHEDDGQISCSLVALDVAYSIADIIQGYSLQSEALHTQRHHSSWDSSDQKLRHTKVMFVSAGDSERSEVTEPETELAYMTLNETTKDLQVDGDDTKLELRLDQDRSILGQGERPSGIVDEANIPFIIDTQGGEPVITGLPVPRIRSISPTPSSSSDEVIVFAGRDTAGKGLSKLPKNSNKTADPYDSRIRMNDDKIHVNQILLAMNSHPAEQTSSSQPPAVDGPSGSQMDSPWEAFMRAYQQPPALMPEADDINGGSYRRGRRRHIGKSKREHEQALIDDYVSNMEAQELDPEASFNQRDLGGTESDPWQATETLSVGPSKMLPLNEWDRLELGDFDVMSTSDEVLGSVQAILSKRSRKNGQQYLVVWEHHNVDEAHWVPASSLTDVNSMKFIAQFEAEEKMTAEISNEEEDGTDSETDSDPVGDEDVDASEDDTDLLQRKIDRITDEKIAKLLAKQEELGMGSSERLLFDDSPGADLDEGDTINHHALKPTRRAFRNVHNAKRATGDFPAASALADAYDGFDVMDFERPSLKKKPKGRKSRLVFDLSDSELEASMVVAWDKDRSKKRERKDERQALRVQGLLGKKDTKPDLKAKYKEGMGIQAVKDEIKTFLMGDNTT